MGAMSMEARSRGDGMDIDLTGLGVLSYAFPYGRPFGGSPLPTSRRLFGVPNASLGPFVLVLERGCACALCVPPTARGLGPDWTTATWSSV